MTDPAPAIDPQAYNTLTFDCYGTLIDWENGILGYLQPLFRSRDVNVIDEFVLTFFSEHEPEVQAAGGSYRQVLSAVLERFATRLAMTAHPDDLSGFADSIEYWVPYPDVVPALKRLAGHFDLAVISNIDDDLFAYSRAQLGVDFAAVVTAEQVGAYKPGPAMFEAALARVKPPVLHVGQSLFHDIAPARALGLDTVWINRGGTSAARTAEVEPTWTFADLGTFADAFGI